MWTTTDRSRPVAVAALTSALIVVFSLVPVPIKRRGFGPYGPDKWPHLVSHAVLAVALADSLSPGRRRPLAAVVGAVGSTALGAVVEDLQDAVPWRTGEGVDVAAGGIGAVLGSVLWLGGQPRPRSPDDAP